MTTKAIFCKTTIIYKNQTPGKKGKLKFDVMPPANENDDDIQTRQVLFASLQGIRPNACVFKCR